MTIALAIPSLTMKNRGGALIRDHALNRANTLLLLSSSSSLLMLLLLKYVETLGR